MPARPELRVGVIGLGFMGRTHLAAYQAADTAGYRCPLVAVCDASPQARTGRNVPAGNLGLAADAPPLFDPAAVRVYADPAQLLADPGVDLVSICTPTDTHVPLTLAALAAGKHVLVEKPLALAAADCDRVVAAADRAATRCMPALCMRFWPGWDWLHDRITGGDFGPVRSAVFRRLGSTPQWAAFYGDPARSGGALVDLHIHDADFVRWCFGDPAGVAAAGGLNHLTALYHYPSGPPHVVAEGAWDHTPGFPFTMRYVVAFEHATADFDLGRDPPLLLARDGRRAPVTLATAPELTGYDLEVRHFLDAAAGRCDLRATAADAAGVARLLERERAALKMEAEHR